VNEDRATRYHRLKRRASIASLVWGAALLVGLLASGGSAALRAAAQATADAVPPGWHSAATVAVYLVLLILVNEIGGLPIAFYSGYILERRYSLSTERLHGWLWDQIKSFAVGLPLAVCAASIVYLFIRLAPGAWWLLAAAVFALVTIGLTNLAPVVLLPLFYDVKPLARESLRSRLVALAERAGARVLGAYEWGLGAKTTKANAALAGLGGTRRILVSDTMLNEYSDDEIEVVLAHELAHHVHGDIWKALLLESALIVVAFYAAARVLEPASYALGLEGPADPAGLPILLLAAGAVSLVLLPAAHAMSRACERSADRFALSVTGNPSAFVSAMKRLAAQNLAEENPSRVVQWLFYSHPPIRERIAAAHAYKEEVRLKADTTYGGRSA
jgi:STE24 endopeptidase